MCKLIVFNFACALSFAALRFGFVADVTLPGMPVAVIWLLLNAAFVVFNARYFALTNFVNNSTQIK